ncbi:TatD family hydrolase [Patescibacteria group bacterium]|nr:TatD family hydrolase [Patescibacteria group bacterium]
MKYFDAHTHVQFDAYDADREEVMSRAKEAEVGMNLVGTQLDTSRGAVELAEKHDEVWASVALHPGHTPEEKFDFDAYEKLALSPKTIAIGECGLDYYRLEQDTKQVQQDVFLQHIELANKVNKPLMLHIRDGARQSGSDADAYLDALALLRTCAKVQGDVHFFAGNWDIAKQFLELGFTLSFTGVLTFTHDYDEVVKNTPMDMLLTETDAPYITPVPYRGQRNEPLYIREVVKKMAELKGVSEEDMRAQILLNSQRIFGLNQ